MKLFNKIKHSSGNRALKKEAEVERLKRGANFHSANRIGIIYKDIDEPHYNKVKAYAKLLKDKFPIKGIAVLGYIDLPYKQLPVWQSQKLEFQYFTHDDLSWNRKPVRQVNDFVMEDFDILIDLSDGNVLPLNFLLKMSKAKMKVGLAHTAAEPFCDFLIDLGNQPAIDKYVDQINLYLSNPKIK